MLPGFGCMIAAAGGGGGNVTLNGGTVTSYGTGIRTASYRISSDGFVYYGDNGIYTSNHRWTSDPVASYEARLTLTLGTNPTGSAMATWLALSSVCTWSISDGTNDAAAVFSYTTVEIRNATSLAVVATADIDIIAERS